MNKLRGGIIYESSLVGSKTLEKRNIEILVLRLKTKTKEEN